MDGITVHCLVQRLVFCEADTLLSKRCQASRVASLAWSQLIFEWALAFSQPVLSSGSTSSNERPATDDCADRRTDGPAYRPASRAGRGACRGRTETDADRMSSRLARDRVEVGVLRLIMLMSRDRHDVLPG
jgi:hypothetical protein